MSGRGSKLDDMVYFSVTSSSSNSNSNALSDDMERNFLRPGTARSLPTPYTQGNGGDSSATGAEDKASLMSNRYLNVDSGSNGNRPRNLSYPSLSSLPPTGVRLINVSSSTKETAGENELHRASSSSSSKSKKGRRSSNRLPPPTPVPTPVNGTCSDLLAVEFEANMPVSPKNIVLAGGGKSNLDFFLDYSLNPFTTKYEVVGNSKVSNTNNEPSSSSSAGTSTISTITTTTSKPQHYHKPKSNVNLKEIETDSIDGAIRRSASISNLGDKVPDAATTTPHPNKHAHFQTAQLRPQDMIVSPNLIKPSYQTPAASPINIATTPNSAYHNQRNNSTNNLFPVQQPSQPSQQPPIASYNRNRTSNEIRSGRISSISDENLAINNPSKFKLTNRNGLISNNQLVKISDWVYCGNLNSVKNERALCHLGIEYVIDISNLRPDDLSRAQTLGKLPCSCKRQQHSRFYLTIEMKDTNFKSLFGAFNEVNKFIQQAKNSSHDESTAATTTISGGDTGSINTIIQGGRKEECFCSDARARLRSREVRVCSVPNGRLWHEDDKGAQCASGEN